MAAGFRGLLELLGLWPSAPAIIGTPGLVSATIGPTATVDTYTYRAGTATVDCAAGPVATVAARIGGI